jgi:hypothetical protein
VFLAPWEQISERPEEVVRVGDGVAVRTELAAIARTPFVI